MTPALRPMQFLGIQDYPDYTQVRVRLPIELSVPKVESVTIGFDPSVTFTVAGETEHDVVFRPTVSVGWKASDELAFGVDIKDTNHTTGCEVDFGLAYTF